jgi:hypothetical protein
LLVKLHGIGWRYMQTGIFDQFAIDCNALVSQSHFHQRTRQVGGLGNEFIEAHGLTVPACIYEEFV